MVLKLYGTPKSPLVLLVAAVLLEKQVPFELVDVDLSKGEHKTPEYLAKHPFGQVPYINDDGFILYESKAICYYIATKYSDQGTPLLPTGLQANSLLQQAIFSEISHFSHVTAAIDEMVYKVYRGQTPDKAIFDKHIADFSAKLDVYDKILNKQKYITGDEFTLADLYYIPTASQLPRLGCNIIETKPNVGRWFKEVSSRASWQAVKDGEIKSFAVGRWND